MLNNTNRYESVRDNGMRAQRGDTPLSRIAARQRELEAELAAARRANSHARRKPNRRQWHVAAQDHADEGWFTTYLDVMTLLLVLLVVMLSFSGTNALKGFQQATSSPAQNNAIAAIPTAISERPTLVTPIPIGIGLLPAPYGLLPEIGIRHSHQPAPEDASTATERGRDSQMPADTIASEIGSDLADVAALTEEAETADVALSAPLSTPAAETPLPIPVTDTLPPQKQVEAAEQPIDLLAGLPLDKLGDDIDVIVNERSVSFRIKNEILFSTAQADLSLEGLAVLKQLVPVFNSVEHSITVEGHTDSVPMLRNRRFPSNWELSGARAASVVRYLEANGVASGRLRAVGNAYTKPLASNNTPEGRASNRRVELIMERRKQE
ncbi:protein MotD [Candidimonas sp. SYP-B2681]|uniref:OmpA/MotB family protein n=1 Tax=Candidimonas sp. SYP-B2681 TaxID=2497686 RepID=UPI000F896D19|nr:OmpA family protein [Candidimonas sp. SYP-B2681]RTZ47715.1 protein MotD [Candidimonas sp. SYP-B2681]